MTKSIMTDLFGGTSCSLPQHRWVNWWMLYKNRQYVIREIKAPVMKAIVGLNKGISWLGMLVALAQIVYYAKRYPEPTKDHTMLPGTHALIDIQDAFFECERNRGRIPLFRAMWRMLIIEYEHDPYYRYRLDWIMEQLPKRGLCERPLRVGSPFWEEE